MSDPFDVEAEARLAPELRARILERGRARLRRRRFLTTGGVALAAIAVAVPLAWAPGMGRTSHVNTGTVPTTSTTSVARTTLARHGRPATAGRGKPATATTTGVAAPPSSSPQVLAPSPTTVPPGSAPATSVPVSAGQPPVCRSGLSASFLSWHERGDVGVWQVDVTNETATPCTLSGYLGVALSLMGRPPTVVPTTRVPDSLDHRGAGPLTLAPGARAHFTLTMLETGNDCPQLLGFLFTPDGPGTFTLPATGTHFFCGRLHVTPPRAGSG